MDPVSIARAAADGSNVLSPDRRYLGQVATMVLESARARRRRDDEIRRHRREGRPEPEARTVATKERFVRGKGWQVGRGQAGGPSAAQGRGKRSWAKEAVRTQGPARRNIYPTPTRRGAGATFRLMSLGSRDYPPRRRPTSKSARRPARPSSTRSADRWSILSDYAGVMWPPSSTAAPESFATSCT